jgi:hypothetical protein
MADDGKVRDDKVRTFFWQPNYPISSLLKVQAEDHLFAGFSKNTQKNSCISAATCKR